MASRNRNVSVNPSTRVQLVRINSDRGYGNGLWRVMATHNKGRESEYELKSEETGEKIRIYTAHCRLDARSTCLASSNARQANAELAHKWAARR